MSITRRDPLASAAASLAAPAIAQGAAGRLVVIGGGFGGATCARFLKAIEPRLINTCYSIVQPDYGISVAGVYRPEKELFVDVEGAGGVSPLEASASTRAAEAAYAHGWFKTITSETFG